VFRPLSSTSHARVEVTQAAHLAHGD